MDIHVRKINKSLIVGWWLIVAILFVSYCGEVIKGERTLSYLAVFLLVTVIPPVLCTAVYQKDAECKRLRYYIVTGYFLMYLFSMATGSTSLVFCYILPLLAFLVLYHQPNLILVTGIAAIVVNVISIVLRAPEGALTLSGSKDSEIQLALLFLCFSGSYAATKLYDEMNRQNNEYVRMLDEKNIQIQKITLQTITTIANTIDAKDEYTKGHSRRVSEYSVAIAEEMGFSEKEIREIRAIALLHDIGKIGVPDAVLNKPGKLTQEEYQLMKQHTVIGAEILKDIEMLPGIDIGAKYHHERYDGKGYPDGLKKEEIPKIARIIAVADAYDAMTSNRVYRKQLTDEKVMSELEKGNGTQFDPEAVTALLKLLKEGKIENISQKAQEEEHLSDASQILARIMERQEELSAERLVLDELTGVYNKTYGERLLKETVGKEKGCLILFDIDHFRLINDGSGYITGDICLKLAAEAMRKMSGHMVVSRFGGDDFVAYTPDFRTKEEAGQALERFTEEVKSTIAIKDKSQEISVSAGVVMCEEGETFEEALIKADKALYVAKTKGGNQSFFHGRAQKEDRALSHTDLSRLVHMMHHNGQYEGAFQTTYPEFQRIYEFIKKVSERNRQKMQMVLFTVLPNHEERVSVEERQRVMELLDKAIIVSVRGVDVTTRYSSTQRLVLLMNMNDEQIHIVTDRIMKEFFRMYEKKEISVYYDIADLDVAAENE